MHVQKLVRRFGLVLLLAGASGCGPPINLQEDLAVTEVFTGWYDNGIKDGRNHLVPSITFRLKNEGERAISSVQLLVDYWFDGEDGPANSVLVRGIGTEAVEPGTATDPITVRFETGYTLEGARSDFFLHSTYRDVTIKMFAKRSGSIAPLGEFRVERRLIPHVPSAPRP